MIRDPRVAAVLQAAQELKQGQRPAPFGSISPYEPSVQEQLANVLTEHADPVIGHGGGRRVANLLDLVDPGIMPLIERYRDIGRAPDQRKQSFLDRAIATIPPLPGSSGARKGAESAAENLLKVMNKYGDEVPVKLTNYGTKIFGNMPSPGRLRPAIIYGDDVYTGTTHTNALASVPQHMPDEIYERLKLDADNRIYVDAYGRVLDRIQAQKMAVARNLIKEDAPRWAHTAPELISENLDLYGTNP